MISTVLSGDFSDCNPLVVGDALLCSSGSTVLKLSMVTGERLGRFEAHTSSITAIKSFAGDCWVVSSSLDGDVIIWNANDMRVAQKVSLQVPVYDLFSRSVVQFDGSASESQPLPLYVVVDNVAERATMDGDGAEFVLKGVKLVECDLSADQPIESGRRLFNNTSSTSPIVAFNLSATDHSDAEDTLQLLVSFSKRRIKLFLPRPAPEKGVEFRFSCESNENITCITVNQHRDLLITGHENGVISLWHDVSRSVRRSFGQPSRDSSSHRFIERRQLVEPPISTAWHWHATAVTALSVVADGSRLVSGGDEGVLVVWQLSDGEKTFLPRLGAPLLRISCPRVSTGIGAQFSGKVAVVTADNALRLVDAAAMREDWVVRSLSVASRAATTVRKHPSGTSRPRLDYLQSDNSWTCKLAVEHRSRCVVCNGLPGVLQVLDSDRAQLVDVYQVTNYVRVSRKEADSKMYAPSVTHLQFFQHSIIGDMLVTMDVRKGEELQAEASLKFWHWQLLSGTYQLVAQMDRPHGRYRITSLACQSDGGLAALTNNDHACCATAAVDGTIKIWRGFATRRQLDLATADRQGKRARAYAGQTLQWTCAYAFKYRDCPVGALAFSADGSILAASNQNMVTLWDPVNVELKASLVHPSPNNVVFCAFVEPSLLPSHGGGGGQAFVVVGTLRRLAVYDLLTMQLVWSKAGSFHAFAVASSDDETVAVEPAKQVAWIVACAKQTVRGAENAGDTTTDEEDHNSDDDDDEADADAIATGSKLLLFGLQSSTPLSSVRSEHRVNSVVFCNNRSRQHAAESQRGAGELLVVTENCELVRFYNPADGNKASDAVEATLCNNKTIPTVKSAVSDLQQGNEQYISAATATTTNSIRSLATLAMQSESMEPSSYSLRPFLGVSSANLPPVADIAGDFLLSILHKRKAGVEHPSTASTTQHQLASSGSWSVGKTMTNKLRSSTGFTMLLNQDDAESKSSTSSNARPTTDTPAGQNTRSSELRSALIASALNSSSWSSVLTQSSAPQPPKVTQNTALVADEAVPAIDVDSDASMSDAVPNPAASRVTPSKIKKNLAKGAEDKAVTTVTEEKIEASPQLSTTTASSASSVARRTRSSSNLSAASVDSENDAVEPTSTAAGARRRTRSLSSDQDSVDATRTHITTAAFAGVVGAGTEDSSKQRKRKATTGSPVARGSSAAAKLKKSLDVAHGKANARLSVIPEETGPEVGDEVVTGADAAAAASSKPRSGAAKTRKKT